MANPARPVSRRLKTPWYSRLKLSGRREGAPWFSFPNFNDVHPLEVLRARLKHWESIDEQYPKCRPEERELLEKSLRSLPEDLRWLASRLEVILDAGYTSQKD